MKNVEYWIWLQSALGYATQKPMAVLEKFESIKQFYDSGLEVWRSLKFFTLNEIKRLSATSLNESYKVINECRRCGYKIITPDDDEYPTRLLRIKDPPIVLYVWGNLPDIDNEVTITMVGTRKCSEGGLRTASVLSYRLAQAGALVLSGGALGIDTSCSYGALSANGKTVIVLGCGLNYPYLINNIDVRKRASENGAVITEYQPTYAPSTYTFPQRNRIMSALSLGVTVIEAPKRSGSLITANHALEQGKDVFAIPGDIMSPQYAGNIKMLQDGALAIYSPYDILSEYVCEFPHKLDLKNAGIPLGEDNIDIKFAENIKSNSKFKKYSTEQGGKKTDTDYNNLYMVADNKVNYNTFMLPKHQCDLSENATKIYNCFTKSKMSKDILINNSELDVGDALLAMTELELNGLISAVPGNQYIIAN